MSSPSVSRPDIPFHGLIGRMRASLRRRSMRVGRRTHIDGRLHVDNDGLIQIGEDCRLSSHPVQSHMVVMANARLIIGHRVSISYGGAMSARCSVQIGDDTHIGPFCLILDNDFHSAGDHESPGDVSPIDIGRHVAIGARVTVLRGARIGDGARVMSGSTVAGVIAPGTVVSGVPARVGGNDSARVVARQVAAVAMRTFGLAALPNPIDGPAQIPAWNDVGSVRLLIALEDAFGVTLPEERVRAARSIAAVTQLVMRANAENLSGSAT